MNDKCIYDFPCQRWLSGQDDDQRTYRTLPVDRQRAFVDGLLLTVVLYFMPPKLCPCRMALSIQYGVMLLTIT